MKYRTRLLLTLLTITLVTNGISTGLMYVRFRDMLFEEIRAKVLSITATASALLDGDLSKRLVTREDEQRPEYAKLEGQLRAVRDANRRPDTYVKFAYTMMDVPGQPGKVQFGVDPEEDPEDKSHLGDVYEADEADVTDIRKLKVDKQFMTDKWGTWLSASAPIRDSSGQVTAAFGADVAAHLVMRRLRMVLLMGLLVFATSGLLAASAARLLSLRLSHPLIVLREAVEAIGKGNLDTRVTLNTRDEFDEVGRAINEMAVGLKEREMVKAAFARYVSQQVMDEIIASGELPKLEGERRPVTLLFSDVRNFTTLSETMEPEQVVALLNDYFHVMVSIVFRNKGTVDKFMGDGLMAIFGAPEPDPSQEENAVRAALEMQEELGALRRKWSKAGRASLRIGIGIHSGQAIVGNIGSHERLDYTAVGDTVNVASRLESSTKEVGCDVLISQSTYEAVHDRIRCREVGSIRVKGRGEPVVAYAVEGWIEQSPDEQERAAV